MHRHKAGGYTPTLKQIRFFVAAVDWGSLSRAASHLNVAQPALSQQIAQLEGGLGGELLSRTTRGVHPTEAGDRFYRHARAILRQVESAVADITGPTHIIGRVAIGLPTSVATVLSFPLLSSILNEYPGIRPELFESLSGYLHELVVRHRLELAILYKDKSSQGLIARPVLNEDLYLVAKRGSLSGTTIRMEDVSTIPLVLPSPTHTLRTMVEAAFAQEGRALTVIADVDSLPTMRKVAASGLAATILPISSLSGFDDAQRPDAARIVEPAISRTLALCSAANQPFVGPTSLVADLTISEMRRLVQSGAWGGAALIDP
ncbi:LysR substrate-binding domain-containing protein [Methylobacterium aerolatum]|uniref:LysR family nitrogen assimilation transcriptional regulator n=1 Tax=Methylobacterium aerolatum TaxID=418708 RepID=A0ABU0I2C7_9HYPH|nr:LysR substrate-binding domain-containing protein [Methylobacterium aerolatum]MDQ0448756.1 LysR family nitrogen assimilation transcriptional regulator [Methylobacterium aerolatum]GJD34028.1 HTH-type transcriptional regulator GltC [Methylobacterium aerolatum]